jgi:hypothetical protein
VKVPATAFGAAVWQRDGRGPRSAQAELRRQARRPRGGRPVFQRLCDDPADSFLVISR